MVFVVQHGEDGMTVFVLRAEEDSPALLVIPLQHRCKRRFDGEEDPVVVSCVENPDGLPECVVADDHAMGKLTGQIHFAHHGADIFILFIDLVPPLAFLAALDQEGVIGGHVVIQRVVPDDRFRSALAAFQLEQGSVQHLFLEFGIQCDIDRIVDPE